MHYGEGPLDAAVNLADGNWHFVAATFDTRQHLAKLYDNGVLLKSKRVVESIAGDEPPKHTYIGCRGYGEFHFHGEIGELLIYNRAISAAQMAKLYAEAGGNCDGQDKDGRVAGYYFDEGRGTTAADFSGHGNTGALRGGVTWGSGMVAAVKSLAADASAALHFDGRAGSHGELPNLDMNRLTFATWVKRDVVDKKQYLIMSAGHGGWGVYFSENPVANAWGKNNYVFFTHKGAGGGHSDLEIADTQWHFIAVTLDRQTLNFYIDGKPAGRAPLGYSIDSQGSLYCLGGTLDDPGSTLLGSLAETLIFNRLLDPAEIAELYRQSRDGQNIGKMAGLIAGYHFDEGQGTTIADFSGRGNHGTLHGGVTRVAGRTPTVSSVLHAAEGSVLNFSQHSGERYVAIPASPSLNSLTDGSNRQLSLAMWVYPTADMNNNGILYKGPLGKGPQDGSQGTFQVSFAHGFREYNELNFRLNGVENFNRPTAEKRDGEVTSSDRVPKNQWTFITCTYDGRQQRIYINGKLSASGNYTAPLQEDASDLFVGIYCNTYEDSNHALSFQGHIDEVGVWKAALDAETISALYNNGQGKYGSASQSPWNADFVAGYHLDEGRGTTVVDFSGNGNAGTLHGGVKWGRGEAAARASAVGISTGLEFGETGYVSIPGKSFRNLHSGTLAVWIRPTAGGGDPHKGGVILSSLHDMSYDRQFYPSVLDKGDGTFTVVVVGVSKNDEFKTCMERPTTASRWTPGTT